jgi:hypothetical protein
MLDTPSQILFQRKYFWLVAAETNDGDLVVPNQFAKVSSASPETAFAGLSIRVCCGKKDARKWESLLPEAQQVSLTRVDGCGTPVEKWLIRDAVVSGVAVEEAVTDEMDSDPDCPFGDFLHFRVSGGFKPVALRDHG